MFASYITDFIHPKKKKNMTYLTILFSLVNYAVLANLILLQKKILPRFWDESFFIFLPRGYSWLQTQCFYPQKLETEL